MADPLIPIQTVRYKTYVKEALVEALSSVFGIHPDGTTLKNTKVTVDLPIDRASFPAIVVRFYERSLKNAGVAHIELLETEDSSGVYYKYKHYLYNGDIEFAVYALSSLDRDLVSDGLVEILAMGDLEPYAQSFLMRIYSPEPTVEPYSVEHYINLNTDEIQGFGETQQIAPWMPEDVLVYQTAYRISIMGEFYSRVPTDTPLGVIENVPLYPYMPAAGETPPDPDPTEPNPWEGSDTGS